jgi:hypothetical protein
LSKNLASPYVSRRHRVRVVSGGRASNSSMDQAKVGHGSEIDPCSLIRTTYARELCIFRTIEDIWFGTLRTSQSRGDRWGVRQERRRKGISLSAAPRRQVIDDMLQSKANGWGEHSRPNPNPAPRDKVRVSLGRPARFPLLLRLPIFLHRLCFWFSSP